MLIALELESMLQDKGYIVSAIATSLPQAEKFIHTKEFDCAILDVNLGGPTSQPVIARLEADNRRFILMSGYSREQLPAELRQYFLLPKPIRAESLLAALDIIFTVENLR